METSLSRTAIKILIFMLLDLIISVNFRSSYDARILQPMCVGMVGAKKAPASLHLTYSQAYEEADNFNRSPVHWEMVRIQCPESGGKKSISNGPFLPGRFRE